MQEERRKRTVSLIARLFPEATQRQVSDADGGACCNNADGTDQDCFWDACTGQVHSASTLHRPPSTLRPAPSTHHQCHGLRERRPFAELTSPRTLDSVAAQLNQCKVFNSDSFTWTAKSFKCYFLRVILPWYEFEAPEILATFLRR